jgi:hypothetical protein
MRVRYVYMQMLKGLTTGKITSVEIWNNLT